MTPSTTFQWPLSPSGIFQPDRSFPLKIETKPAGGALCACGVETTGLNPKTSAAAKRLAVAFMNSSLRDVGTGAL